LKLDFQRKELLLANFSKLKLDFQRQELLLANFSKKPKFNAFSYFKNSCMQCMKGPKIILE
jgi:hypothetical protein